MGWREVHVGIENDGLMIGGLDVWKHEWRQTDEPVVRLPPPRRGFTFTTIPCWIWEIGDVEHPIRFAAGEVSNGAWDFYVPDSATTST